MEASLEQLAGIADVAVVAGSTADAPWEVVLLAATTDNGGYRSLESAITRKRGATQLADNSGAGNNSQQSIGLPDGAEAVVWYGQETVVLSTGMEAGDVKAALEGLDALRAEDVEVTGGGTTADPWQISLTPKDGGSASYERMAFAVIETVADPARVQADSVVYANRVQELAAEGGPMTIWYGRQGVDVGSDTGPGLTAADIEAALKSLQEVNRVFVTGTGTADEPWRIVVVDADRAADGSFHGLKSERYELSGTPLQQAGAKRQSRDAALAAQAVSLENWQDHARMIYGDEAIEVSRDMTAAEVAEALESLESIRDVWVSGGGTAEDAEAPWHVVFLDADLDAEGNPYPLQREVSVQRMTRQLDVATGSITLPVDLAGALFSYQDTSVAIGLSDGVGPDDMDLLSSLGAGSNILVEGSGTFDDPWIITVEDCDADDPVTVEYDFGGLQALAGSSASYQVIERLSDDGAWAIERNDAGNDAGQYAVYSTATDAAGSAVYLSACQTVERNVPRLLEKPVWEDLDGDGVVEQTGETEWFEDPTWVNDQRVDTVCINGSDDFDDYFLIGHEVLNAGSDAEEEHADTVQVTHQRLDGGNASTVVITLRGLDLNDPARSIAHDQVTIDAGGGNNRLIAGFLPNSTEIHANQILTARAVDNLALIGGSGDDRIVGSPYADSIDSGEGNDTVTGNGGVDSFADAGGNADTLIEARDLNFMLSDTQLAIAGQRQSAVDPALMESVNEREDGVAVFERFELFGGAHGNNFALHDFTRQAWLDGTGGSDTYVLTLSGTLSGQSSVYVADSGTGSIDSDHVEIRGGDVADTLHLDADTSLQQLVRKAPGTFTLAYGGETTEQIEDADAAGEIAAKLEALSTIRDVTVTGSGTAGEPWMVEILTADVSAEGKFLRLQSSHEAVAAATVARATVQRIEASLAAALLAGKPDLDAMFERPANETQLFYLHSGISGTFELQYNDEWTTAALSHTSDAAAVKAALEGLDGITDVDVTGSGTFISDDSMAALYVYGDSGNDNFLIGRVLKTKTVVVGGRKIDVVDGPDGITPGVSFNGYFYGGTGDDYFEVNHNVGELQLFGESGDDTFFLKAQLQDVSDGGVAQVSEMDGGLIIAGAGDDQNNIAEGDADVLINYIENNRVEVFGGSGFDTVVVAGTALDDTFYIFTDGDGRQYLYGAGLKLEDFHGIERLAVLTGAGDDTVYLYGLDESLSLLLNLGSGNDRLIVGGPEETFEVSYPASSAVYTVQQQILADVFQNEAITYNDVVFTRRSMTPTEKQQAWRQFYYLWIYSTRYPSEIPTTLPQDVAAVSISERHWNLLEANLAVALKLFAQGVEKAAHAPVYDITLSASSPQQRSAYLQDVNVLEGVLENLNHHRWDMQRVWREGKTYWSRLYNALLSEYWRPKLPDQVEFEVLAGIVPTSGLSAGPRTLDHVFYQEYLREVVAYTVVGDMICADQVRLGTELTSPRLLGWGYEPDLYQSDLYKRQIPAGGRWMEDITGETGAWIPDSFKNNPGVGEALFRDLISLFYDVEAPTNQPINVEHTYSAREQTGAASYRFDDLPERTVDKILPANYDLSRIAGVVRLGGGAGSDTVIINAHDAAGTGVTLTKQVLELAEYSFDVTALEQDLPPGVTHEDLQAALVRANKETQIGVLDQLADGEILSTDVQLSVHEKLRTHTLRERLVPLGSAVETLRALSLNARQSDYCYRAQEFVLRGRQLLGDEVTSVAEFSLDALDELLEATVLREMVEGSDEAIRSAAKDVKTTLLGLRDYLTLIAVKNALELNGYHWSGDTALRVYRQVSPDLSNRTTVYRYRQEIWEESTYDEATTWHQGSGAYSGRLNPLDPNYLQVEELTANDLDNERGTRELREIRYTVDGTPYVTDPSLAGNQIEMEKAYVAALDNLDTSYYTYSYYGVGSDGHPVLESVAIRRLNDRDPAVNAAVAGKSALVGGVYLTNDDWSSYLDALSLSFAARQTIDAAYAANGFSDETVVTLMQTAFGQTLRTDVTAPIMDGLLIEHTDGNVDSIDIQSLQDDAGFHLPKEVTVNRSTELTRSVNAGYVLGRRVGTEYTVTYDQVLGLNGRGLWFGGFETLEVDLGGQEGSFAADDTVTVESTHHLTSLTVDTGDGNDEVTVAITDADTTICGGGGDDTIKVNSFTEGAVLNIDGQGGSDEVHVKLEGNGLASINVLDTGDWDDGTDSLTIDGQQRTNPLNGSLTGGADGDSGLLWIADSAVDATFNGIQTIETLTLDLGPHNDMFEVNNSLADVDFTIYGHEGHDDVTVTQIGGETKFEGGEGTDTLTINFRNEEPHSIGDLAFHTETVVVDNRETVVADNSSYTDPVAWQVTGGSLKTSHQQDDILLINDETHVAAKLRIVGGKDSTLEVTDADGAVTIDGGTPENGYENRIELVQGSTTVLSYLDSTNVALPWTAGPKLLADDEFGLVREFGYSVAVSGDTVIVGAPGKDDGWTDCGSAYVFRRNGTGWRREAKLVVSDGAAWANFGSSVAISGDTVIVGAPDDDFCGSAYIFQRKGVCGSTGPRDSIRHRPRG